MTGEEKGMTEGIAALVKEITERAQHDELFRATSLTLHRLMTAIEREGYVIELGDVYDAEQGYVVLTKRETTNAAGVCEGLSHDSGE